MGNSQAYPVLRTDDAFTAYAQATRLCALLADREDAVGVFAELRTVQDVRRMADVLPGAAFAYDGARKDSVTGEYVWFDLEVTALDDTELEAHLPLSVREDVPTGSVEERFVAALGRGAAAIEWHGMWPDDPEGGRYGSPKYDGVQVVFHCDDPQWGEWAEHHTVFVHVTKFGDLSWAEELAARVGGEVLGEAHTGW
ncbi:hypothetical protein AB0A69_07110 [Streptomyces sp. NPDC045431]|uniref:hypothetical protein n=1 Tax=Streptomyces sp. NPDC045431 TaxID=3155613 RepID=UPI0033DFA0BA